MTPIEASLNRNQNLVCSNLRDRRDIRKPKFNLGILVPPADIKRVFSRGESINWSYKVYTITEVIHDTNPSYPIYSLREKYNENLLKSTNLFLDENNKFMEEINLIKKINIKCN